MAQEERTLEFRDAANDQQDVHEMLLLASRLKESHGGDLDDAAIMAVAEATGATPEYVRLALRSVPAKEARRTPLQRVKSFLLSLDPVVRRYVAAGYLGTGAGVANAILATFGDPGSLLGIAVTLCAVGALWNAAVSPDRRTAMVAGALFSGLGFVANALALAIISFFHSIPSGPSPIAMILAVAGSALIGSIAYRYRTRAQARSGPSGSGSERQELLRQLVELQDKLRSGEQTMSFLSLDIVGSTRIKELADPLAVEFTFTEYHRFVETVVGRHGGRVHSTAGDGVTCAFDHPQQAFAAARNIQSGLIELNLHRNRVGVPIKLRAGIHHGSVISTGPSLQNINFSHVIDIAAHLQKACPEGGVAISIPAASMLAGGEASVGPDTIVVQNVSARIWRPRSAIPVPGPSPAAPAFQPEV